MNYQVTGFECNCLHDQFLQFMRIIMIWWGWAKKYRVHDSDGRHKKIWYIYIHTHTSWFYPSLVQTQKQHKQHKQHNNHQQSVIDLQRLHLHTFHKKTFACPNLVSNNHPGLLHGHWKVQTASVGASDTRTTTFQFLNHAHLRCWECLKRSF